MALLGEENKTRNSKHKQPDQHVGPFTYLFYIYFFNDQIVLSKSFNF